MNNFGKIKSKLLKKLTEAYTSNNFKQNTKNLIKVVKKNKDFKEMYLFYEEIENKYIEDKEVAKLYVEQLGNLLKEKAKKINSFCEVINMSVHDAVVEANDLYDSIDQLLEEDNLKNIDKKVIAKKKLVEHLIAKKENVVETNDSYTVNESLLHAVLANNFNVLYGHTLNEEQKETLKNIMSLSDEELTTKVNELKESVSSKVESLLSESTEDTAFISKLSKVKNEVTEMKTSKYNYYRLTELKNGLD
jgi:succinate dehydrogenase flavin-adding protein (antitoxin of CptAB toxin-antitoxin module)